MEHLLDLLENIEKETYESLNEKIQWDKLEGVHVLDVYGFLTTHVEYPKILKKPSKYNLKTPEDYEKYAQELRAYQQAKEDYNVRLERSRKKTYKIDLFIKKYLILTSGAYRIVPQDKIEKVWNLAYQYGHSAGHGEVNSYLIDIIEIFV